MTVPSRVPTPYAPFVLCFESKDGQVAAARDCLRVVDHLTELGVPAEYIYVAYDPDERITLSLPRAMFGSFEVDEARLRSRLCFDLTTTRTPPTSLRPTGGRKIGLRPEHLRSVADGVEDIGRMSQKGALGGWARFPSPQTAPPDLGTTLSRFVAIPAGAPDEPDWPSVASPSDLLPAVGPWIDQAQPDRGGFKNDDAEADWHAAEVFTRREFAQRPRPTELIPGLIQQGSLTTVYGAPGGGKTLLAQALAASYTTGVPWMGRPLSEQGAAVYIAAEGASVLDARLEAWEQYYGQVADRLVFVTGAPPFFRAEKEGTRGDLERWAKSILRKTGGPVGLLVIDTLASTMVGGDESRTQDMVLYLRGVKRLAALLGCRTIMLIHHTNKDGGAERGSTALRGDCDTMLSVGMGQEGVITVFADKQRGMERGGTVVAEMTLVTLADGSQQPVPVESNAAPGRPARGGKPPGGRRSRKRNAAEADMLALSVLEMDCNGSAASGDWEKAIKARDEKWTHNDHADALNRLRGAELVEGGGKKGTPYTITAAGREQLEESTSVSFS